MPDDVTNEEVTETTSTNTAESDLAAREQQLVEKQRELDEKWAAAQSVIQQATQIVQEKESAPRTPAPPPGPQQDPMDTYEKGMIELGADPATARAIRKQNEHVFSRFADAIGAQKSEIAALKKQLAGYEGQVAPLRQNAHLDAFLSSDTELAPEIPARTLLSDRSKILEHARKERFSINSEDDARFITEHYFGRIASKDGVANFKEKRQRAENLSAPMPPTPAGTFRQTADLKLPDRADPTRPRTLNEILDARAKAGGLKGLEELHQILSAADED